MPWEWYWGEYYTIKKLGVLKGAGSDYDTDNSNNHQWPQQQQQQQ